MGKASGPTGLDAGCGKAKGAPPTSCPEPGSQAAVLPSEGTTRVNAGHSVRGGGGRRDTQGKQEADRTEGEERLGQELLSHPHAPPPPCLHHLSSEWPPRLLHPLGLPSSHGVHRARSSPSEFSVRSHRAEQKSGHATADCCLSTDTMATWSPPSHADKFKWERQRQLPQQSSRRRRQRREGPDANRRCHGGHQASGRRSRSQSTRHSVHLRIKARSLFQKAYC